jgi:hypothetical protein
MRTVIATLAGVDGARRRICRRGPAPAGEGEPLRIAGAPFELVRQGCGYGWHRGRWRDRWGYWH